MRLSRQKRPAGLAERLEIHYTPKHGQLAQMAEIELSALNGQCLDRRIPDLVTMRRHVACLGKRPQQPAVQDHWRFTTDDARIKLRRLYPKL